MKIPYVSDRIGNLRRVAGYGLAIGGLSLLLACGRGEVAPTRVPTQIPTPEATEQAYQSRFSDCTPVEVVALTPLGDLVGEEHAFKSTLSPRDRENVSNFAHREKPLGRIYIQTGKIPYSQTYSTPNGREAVTTIDANGTKTYWSSGRSVSYLGGTSLEIREIDTHFNDAYYEKLNLSHALSQTGVPIDLVGKLGIKDTFYVVYAGGLDTIGRVEQDYTFIENGLPVTRRIILEDPIFDDIVVLAFVTNETKTC